MSAAVQFTVPLPVLLEARDAMTAIDAVFESLCDEILKGDDAAWNKLAEQRRTVARFLEGATS